MSNFTVKAITQSLMKLLETKPFNKITVRDIVEDCGISRNTFYYHFEDIPSLLNSIFMETANEIISRKTDTESLEDCIDMAMDYVRNNRRIVMNIYRSSSREIFEKNLTRICEYSIDAYIGRLHSRLDLCEEDRQIIKRIMGSVAFGLVIDWLNQNMSYDMSEQLRRYHELRIGELGTVIEQLFHD